MLLDLALPQRVERDRRCIGDVEAGHGGCRRQAHQLVAALAGESAQSCAFCTEDQDDTTGGLPVANMVRSFLGEA